MLLTGDAAMGTTANQAEAGLERLIRPPIDFNLDDAKLREQWLVFDFNLPFSIVLPFHGTGYIDGRKEDSQCNYANIDTSRTNRRIIGII